MRFARYDADGTRVAVLGEDERLHELAAGETVEALIERGGLGALLDAGAAALHGAPGPAPAQVRLLAPLRPASIRDSVSFEAHIEGARRSQEGATGPVPARWYEAPCFYFTNPPAYIGAFDDVQRFPGSELFDLECEVGVVYGAHGRNLTPQDGRPGSSATRSSTSGRPGTSSGSRASCRSASSRGRTAPTRSGPTW
jgi:2-keto-4-pentenoate hydratase/2-oxohepta-3-ene-1,7-dioic acid hydratase in catechol pathway